MLFWEPTLHFKFNYYVLEIFETRMPLIYKPLVQGLIVPEMLEATVYGR